MEREGKESERQGAVGTSGGPSGWEDGEKPARGRWGGIGGGG